MIGVPGREGNRDVQVIIGVDTHQDEHVAVAIDRQGVRLGERHAPATTHGYGELEWWSLSLGEVRAFGIEGTGSYGAGIARFLTGRGYTVVEVNRPDRSTRYRKGKSDPTDAEMAARSVLAGVADATPKSGQGEVEMIRMLKSNQGLGRQGPHPGHQPDEGSGCHRPSRTSAKPSTVSPLLPSPPGARVFVPVVWTIPRRRPSTLSAHWPAATAN